MYKVLLVPELRKNLLSMSTLEVDVYAILHYIGHVIIYPMGESLDASRVLGIKYGRMYKVLAHPLDGESGSISDLMAVLETLGEETYSSLVRRHSLYEITLEDE